MQNNGREFVDKIKRFKANTQVKTNQAARQKALQLFNMVVEATPVDTGHARAGWQISYGTSPAATQPTKGQKKMSAGAMQSAVNAWNPSDGIIWMANAVPYIKVLEYGLYPNPVERGTYLKKGQRKGEYEGPGFFPLSEGGFSKQLPQGGMVRLSLLSMGVVA